MILVGYFLLVLSGLCTLHRTKGSTSSWTGWCNEDNPDSGEVELERLDIIKVERCPDVCRSSEDIECRVERTHQPWNQTGDILVDKCNRTRGLSCINSYQTSGRCQNYEVRYLCPKGVEVTGAGSSFWTRWCDEDGPYGRGDEEVTEYCTEVCAEPLSVECRVVRTHDLWNETGDVFSVPCSPAGLTCLTADQPNRLCQDYEIRFQCNSACDGKCGNGTHCVKNSVDKKDYCLCQDGHKNRRKDGLTSIYTCSAYTDCNSLSEIESKCHQGSGCVNSVDENDGYSCVCDAGYSLTSKWFISEKRSKYSCSDTNECSSSPCGAGNCTNTDGGFFCRCEPHRFTAEDQHSCLSPLKRENYKEENSSAGIYVGVGIGIGVVVAVGIVLGIFLVRRFLKKRPSEVSPAKDKPLIDKY